MSDVISEADVVALDQIILEMQSQQGVFPWMVTVSRDLQQIRDHIANTLPGETDQPLTLDATQYVINRNDPVGTVAADLMPAGGVMPYSLLLTDNDNGNFRLGQTGQAAQVQKNRASINQGFRTVTVALTDDVGNTCTLSLNIEVLA